MGVDKIVSKIEADTEEKIEEIKANADKRIADMREEYKEREEEKRKKTLEEAREEEEAIESRKIADARIKSRREIMSAREELINEAFSKGYERLKEITKTDEYRETLKNLIKESALGIGGGDLVVLTNERSKEIIDDEMLKEISDRTKANITLGDETVDCSGGAIVKTADGRMMVDNTFESRMKRYRDVLRPEISKLLFET